MKLIKSLENREILLKGTTRKTTSQEGGFLNIFRPSMTVGLPNQMCTDVSVLLLLILWAGMSAADAAIQKRNIHGSGTTALIISNEEMEDLMKIVKSREESGLLIKRTSGNN